jgi:hypothetical protein
LSEQDHELWWYAHLHELGAIYAAALIRSSMTYRDQGKELNFVVRFFAKQSNEAENARLRKSHRRYVDGLQSAKLHSPSAFYRHYMTTPFERGIRLVDDLNPGMFDEELKRQKIALEKEALAED